MIARASLKRVMKEKEAWKSRRQLEKLNWRMDELNGEMFEALEKVDESLIEKLMLELNSLKEENANFLNPMGILFGDPEE